MSNNTSYDGHKDILFSGLCIWVLRPNHQDTLRKHGMVLTGMVQLRRAERLARNAAEESKNHFADQLGRLFGVADDFYYDFYYPIGGCSRLINNLSLLGFKNNLRKTLKSAKTIVLIMRILDFHARHLRTEVYYPASLRKSAILAEKTFHLLSEDNAEKYWQKSFTSASLIYAASTLEIKSEYSLLDAICDGTADYSSHGALLPQWLARSRYAADVILAGFEQVRFPQANQAYLPAVEPELTPEPMFSPSEEKAITDAFDRKLVSENREQIKLANRQSKAKR